MMLAEYRTRLNDCARFVRFFAVLATVLVLSCVFGAAQEHAAGSKDAVLHPIVIELFTSEGCSSCPPADAWVQQLDSSQPIPGAQIIVLSEHVTYWDQDGWKDPYSSVQLTRRQSNYAQGLRISDVYTPQLILDGGVELHLNDPQQVKQAIEKAAATPAVFVRLDSIGMDAGDPGTLDGRVEVDAQGRGGEVYVATTLDHAESQVLRGENSGHRLKYVAVVEDIVKIGKLEKGKSFDGKFHVKLRPGTDPANVRVVAFVQEPGLGRILGAAMEKNATESGLTHAKN